VLPTINPLVPAGHVHPRLRYYPHHADYLGLEPEFRPFVMFTDEPNYRSPSVNTDKFGLREQYDAEGDYIDLKAVRATHPECNVLLGGSTVFGVDATSDRATLSQHLHRPGVPCLNLGFRAATGQQELIMFLLLKQYFARVLNVVLLTGVNDCALAARPGTRIYPGFGGVFYEGAALSPARQQELLGVTRYRTGQLVDRVFVRSRAVRGVLRLFLGRGSGSAPGARMSFDEKLDESMGFVENTIHTWGRLQASGGFKVHFVLQPAIGWTKKPLTAIERECFDADVALFPETSLFSAASTYQQCRNRLAASCERNEIEFHDANEWLDEAPHVGEEIFTDVCHLSDGGARLVSGFLRDRLNWRES